ncbi:uncharacterized protein RJT21DRAFT_120114 [Scheffersomyces amazonensis]|uniref:uncharacterized protein n=1 Tax=Scheffersomyces amazonensis TaxID=1078765 RepID=UPI00315DA05D
MIRRFPFVKTCQNVYLNLKNYKPSTQRPSFHATNHAFVSNIQLLDQNYFNWLRSTSKELPSHIMSSLRKSPGSRNSIEQLDFKYLKKAAPSSVVFKVSSATNPIISSNVTSISTTIQEDEDEEVNHQDYLLSLCQSTLGLENLVQQLPLLQIGTDMINQLIDKILLSLPTRSIFVSDCLIEEAKYFGETNLECLAAEYYRQLYEKLPYIQQICQIHKASINYDSLNHQFQEHLIWLGYHYNDLKTLELLIHPYITSNQPMNSKILSYFFASFIKNYEIEYARDMLDKVVRSSHKLETILIETIVQKLISIDILFDKLIFIFSIWLNNNGNISAKLISILLDQYYEYGEVQEITNFLKVVNSFKISNYMIDFINLKYKIINREPTKFKKLIVETDLKAIETIKQSITTEEELYDFYYQILKFLVNYSNMNYVNLILMSLKNDNLIVYPEFFTIIANYYSKNQQFLQLFRFLESIHPKTKFNSKFIDSIFKGFINTYPHMAIEFYTQFLTWLASCSLPESLKQTLRNSLKIVKLESQLTPYNNKKIINNKLKSIGWKPIYWRRPGKVEQIQFRLSSGGFQQLVESDNIRPDFDLIKSTFRGTSSSNHANIIYIMKKSRLLTNSNKIQMELYSFQMYNSDKQELLSFYNDDEWREELNNHQKIFFARILMNKKLNYQSLELLDSIKDINTELNPQSKQLWINWKLRNLIKLNRFEDIIEEIDKFPINETIFSQYLIDQCGFLEKQMLKKIDYFNRKNDTLRIQQCTNTLEKLQGLIGDISIRIEQDEQDLRVILNKTFILLNDWIDRDYNLP